MYNTDSEAFETIDGDLSMDELQKGDMVYAQISNHDIRFAWREVDRVDLNGNRIYWTNGDVTYNKRSL